MNYRPLIWIIALVFATAPAWSQAEAAPLEEPEVDLRVSAMMVALKVVGVILLLVIVQLMRRQAQRNVERLREAGRKPWEKRG